MDRRDFVRLGAVAGALTLRGKPLSAEIITGEERAGPRSADQSESFIERAVCARGNYSRGSSGGDGVRTDDGAVDNAAVHRSNPGTGSHGPDTSRSTRDKPRRIVDCRRSRSRAEGRQSARTPARNSDSDQGQHRHRRPDDDDGRVVRSRRIDRAPGRHHRGQASCGRRHPARQDESQRMGEFPVDALIERLERTRRAGEEPVRARSKPVRLELGDRGRGLREHVRCWDRNRDGRLDRVPVVGKRNRGNQADARPGESRGNHPDRAQSGHRRSDDAHCARRRHPARRFGRSGSARSRDIIERHAWSNRLHEVSRSQMDCVGQGSVSRERSSSATATSPTSSSTMRSTP